MSNSDHANMVVEKALRKYVHLLHAKPEQYAEKFGITLSWQGASDPKTNKYVRDALVLWAVATPESAFWECVRDRLRHRHSGLWFKSSASAIMYRIAKEETTRLLTHVATGKVGERTITVYDQVVAFFMHTPEAVVRRWLWYENVDFQTRESFLRRLTRQQYESLREHWQEKEKLQDELPCFRDGVVNKIWRLFGLPRTHEVRMKPKSALAYNFFGMDMGFQLYPDTVSMRQSTSDLSRQFLSHSDRGSFELSRETGGLYWYLYKTLRSNTLWNKHRDVELGAWICPGFWFTMALWFCFLTISPLALLWGVTTSIAGGETASYSLAVGAVTPVLLFASWAIERARKTRVNDDYVIGVSVGFLIFVVAVLGYFLLTHLSGYLSFWVMIPTAMLLVPYILVKQRLALTPYIGKPLVVATFSALAYDLYKHTYTFERIWEFLLEAYAWALSVLPVLMLLVGAVAMYALFFFGANWFEKRRDHRLEEIAKTGAHSKLKESVTLYWITGVVAALLMVVYVIIMLSIVVTSMSTWYLIPIILGLSALAYRYRGVFSEKYDPNFWVAQRVASHFTVFDGPRDELVQALQANASFWFDENGDVRTDLLSRVVGCLNGGGHRWVPAFVRSIRSVDEVAHVERFINEFRDDLSNFCRPTPELVRMVLSGAGTMAMWDALDAERLRERNHKGAWKGYWEQVWEQVGEWVDRHSATLEKWLRRATWIFRVIGRGISDGARLWKQFNESCPRSPETHRVSAQ